MIETFIHAGIINPDDVAALEAHLKALNSRVVFLDATFVLPTSKENILETFSTNHIPNARFFDIKSIAKEDTNLPHMLPDYTVFEKALSTLGIKNDDFVIIYGQHGMIMGPARVWWMFKGFGHDRVAVLNGGLPAWIKEGFETNAKPPSSFEPAHYRAEPFHSYNVIDMKSVSGISSSNEFPIVDARPYERFAGTSPEPRENMRSGHIPGSANLPCSQIVGPDGKMKSREELKQLFHNIGINLEKNRPDRIITTCGSGITACVLALALYHLGYDDVAVYDGSWSEWGQESSPTEVKTV